MEFFCHIESKNDELPQGKVSTIFNFCQVKWPKYRIFNTFQCPFSSFYRPSVSQKRTAFLQNKRRLSEKSTPFSEKSWFFGRRAALCGTGRAHLGENIGARCGDAAVVCPFSLEELLHCAPLSAHTARNLLAARTDLDEQLHFVCTQQG